MSLPAFPRPVGKIEDRISLLFPCFSVPDPVILYTYRGDEVYGPLPVRYTIKLERKKDTGSKGS